MRKSYLYCLGLVILLLAVGKVGQAQDSLGMRLLSGLDYWVGAEGIQMVGNLAYIVGCGEMHIINLTDPVNPEEIGRFTWYQWDGASGGVYVLGNRAYLGTYGGGIVLDISDPTNPVELGQWYSGHMSDISFVNGEYAIGQSDEGYPYVLNISNPTNVHQIGDFPISGPQRGVGLAGEYLCLTGHPGGLVLFDMSNPAEPRWVASIDTALLAHHAAISGNYAYVATLYNGLRIIDLSNPLQPVEVAACDSGGWTEDVTVTGFHTVTMKYSVSDAWLNVWNVANPAHPVFEGMIPTHTFGSYRVSSSGNLVCATAAGPYYSVMVVDISNPAAPVEVSSFGPNGILTRMAISGNTAYLADRVTGLRIVNFTDPYHVSELAHMNSAGAEGLDVAISGNYAYVTEDQWSQGTNGVVVFEVSNPAQPESLGYVFPSGGRQIVIVGDYAYVAGHYLCTFSLANPAVPLCVDMQDLYAPSNGWFGLAESNGCLYFGNVSTFYVYSLSNPAAPQLIGSCNLQAHTANDCVFDLAATDRYVYVADGYGGMRIVEVNDSAHPSEINWIGGYWVGSVSAAENLVIMDDRTRISIYDVTNPLNPILVGYYTTYEDITDMEIQGQYLFTTSECEFRVYQCDALPNVVVPHEPLPTEFNLLPPYPNPFNSVLIIPFTIPIQKEVTINIYNILGQKVQEFALPPLSPGAHRILWDATACASGVYIIQLISGKKEFRQKATLLK